METAIDDVLALRVLAEPQRARIYNHLAAVGEASSRHEVARALGIGRTLVAFHLDKLEQAGLIKQASPEENPPGRPGRPPQLFQVTGAELSASVPPRRYDLLAEVLVEAISEQRPDEELTDVALAVARRRGMDLAAQLGPTDRGSDETRGAIIDVFRRLGYEPTAEGAGVLLTNCPFHRLRQIAVELVCSINAALVAGYLEGLGTDAGLVPRQRPCPTNCCVVLDEGSA